MFSGARLLTLGIGTARYDQILTLSKMPDSVLFKRDVENADRQDDGAAYRIFCSNFLEQVYKSSILQDFDKYSLFIYLFVIGKDLLFIYLLKHILIHLLIN